MADAVARLGSPGADVSRGRAADASRASTRSEARERSQLDRRGVVRLTVPRVPGHVVALVGLTAGGYAVALAGVAALQSSAESATAAARAPLAEAVAAAAAGNERLAARVAQVFATEAKAADRDRTLTDAVGRAEAGLGTLSASVTGVDGAAQALPAHVSLPTIRVFAPSTAGGTAHATTGGSGKP